ncbi:hypothetical protein SLEP1_g14314 [Rubroshorea leprosula]|uniref:Reverse transcriptase zinc-binding domain-containing protein n=1 Tax=Rubroshorea leprosula TaxID=152421 RepID=A0AAV5IPG7_9ROSI|nr:hypothetical protein SLEP1_g14314 [Rubroshorea leprosula]
MINWDKVSLLKSLGGLGIKSAKEANMAAMAKLNWRLFSERDKLWNCVSSGKYNIEFRPSTLPSYGSFVIKNLNKDCGAFPLSSFDPSLISYPTPSKLLETSKATLISEVGVGQDSYSCKGTPDGSFSLKFAYLMAKGLDLNPKGDWKWIWRIHTLLKIQSFIWLLRYERLKTLEFLSRLNIVDSDVCPLYLGTTKSCVHLYRECSFFSIVWLTFFPQGNVSSGAPFFEQIRDNCTIKDKCPTIPIPWGTVFSFILRNI